MNEPEETLKHIRTVISAAIISNIVLFFLDTPVSIIGIVLQVLLEVQLLLVWFMVHALLRKHASHN
ncbi:MAG: hypothetical protein H3C35_13160 [Bacteroidetes bacterium]|nr:hypothetical protein [Bacteroidota bacterium]